jgi:glutathione S-transferase
MTARETLDLTITRVIRAPRKKVYDAFTQPALMRQWFGLRGSTCTDAAIDARVGGHFRMSVHHRTGETYVVGGVYRELKSPEKIVFTWKWETEPMSALGETLVSVMLEERRGEHGVETVLELLHSGFPTDQARQGHNEGWNSGLNRLVEVVDPRGTQATLVVLGSPRSTYVRSVRMALAEKGVAYEHQAVAPHSPELLAVNPFGRMPAFRDGDFALYETSAILRYIDESFPGPSLIATNLRARARMEQWVSLIIAHCYDAMVRRYVLQYVFPKGAGGAPDRAVIDAAIPEMRAQLHALEQGYGARNMLAGDAVTIADLLLAPIVAYLGMFPESKAILAELPNVRRAHAAIGERPSFQSTLPPLG